MELRTKKLLTNVGLAVWFFFAGVEYAVIIPTAWLYVESLGGDKFFFGMMFSSFSAAGLVSGILFGIWADRVGKTKWIVIFANLWAIAGNLLYSVGISKYLILVSRLLSGAGAGVGSAIFAQLTHTSANEERTRIFSYFMAMRMFGIMIGPGFNFFLRLCNFYIGPIKIDAFTVPGLFMAILTALLQIYMVFFLFDLPHIDNQPENISPSGTAANKKEEEMQNSTSFSFVEENWTVSQETLTEQKGISLESHDSKLAQLDQSNEMSRNFGTSASTQRSYDSFHTCQSNMHSTTAESLEFYKTASLGNIQNGGAEGQKDFTAKPNNGHASNQWQSSVSEVEDSITGSDVNGESLREVSLNHSDRSEQVTQASENPPFLTLLSDVVREETVVLLALMFCIVFNQAAVETMLTPLTDAVFGWREKENSIFFICAAAEMVICMMAIGPISKKIQDRTIILGGLLMSCLSLSWLLVFMSNKYDPSRLPYFLVGFGMQILSIAPVFISTASLFSKVTDIRIQGFCHGIRRGVGSIASIIGPLWGGATVRIWNVSIGVLIAMVGFVLVLVLLSFGRLKDPHVPVEQDRSDGTPTLTVNVEADEQTPLLKETHPTHAA